MRGRPPTGKAVSAVERMRRHRERRRAAGLRLVTRWRAGTSSWSDQRVAEARSLALHVLAARRIAAEPRLLRRARATLKRWLERYGEQPPAALREWEELVERPCPERAAKARGPSQDVAGLGHASARGASLSA